VIGPSNFFKFSFFLHVRFLLVSALKSFSIECIFFPHFYVHAVLINSRPGQFFSSFIGLVDLFPPLIFFFFLPDQTLLVQLPKPL